MRRLGIGAASDHQEKGDNLFVVVNFFEDVEGWVYQIKPELLDGKIFNDIDEFAILNYVRKFACQVTCIFCALAKCPRHECFVDEKMGGERCNAQFWAHSIILWCSLCWVVHGSSVKNVTYAVTRQLRSVGFPEGSGMGIFFAVSIPVDVRNKAVTVSFYFEANYGLPLDKNSSNFEDYLENRSLDRRLAYEIVENKLERAGYPGRVCLMRAICDAAHNPVTKNGLLGDLLHILLTPSSSKDDKVPDEVKHAEFEKDCTNRYGDCPVNVLDLISHYI